MLKIFIHEHYLQLVNYLSGFGIIFSFSNVEQVLKLSVLVSVLAINLLTLYKKSKNKNNEKN